MAVGAVCGVLFASGPLLGRHRLRYLDVEVGKRRDKALRSILRCVVGYLYALGRNIDLYTLYTLAVEVVVDFVGTTLTVDVGDEYGCDNLLLGLCRCCCLSGLSW